MLQLKEIILSKYPIFLVVARNLRPVLLFPFHYPQIPAWPFASFFNPLVDC